MKKGIDVSNFQGTIDWGQVKAAGYEFAILRAGWGKGSVDPKFKRNADECTRLGIPFGAYWFSYALNPSYAVREAQSAMKVCSGYILNYGIWFDFEYDSISWCVKNGVNVTKENASAMAKAFMETVKAAGIQTGNYTNLDFSKRYFTPEILNNYDRWAARYTSNKVDIVNGAELWQYSSKGYVPGIAGNVDMDFAIKEYPGTVVPNNDVDVTPAKDVYSIPAVYSLVYDTEYYLSKYPDLQNAVTAGVQSGAIPDKNGGISWWLYQHFLKYGMSEARQAISTFDVVKYRNTFIDLQKAFGDDWKAYYYHYMQFGAKEIAEGKRQKFM